MDPKAIKDPLLGRVIAGKYEILRRLGAGGMGAVYHARHTQTGGDCAVKFLHGTAVGDEQAVRRFQLEAQNAAALRHTNTIRVTDFGVDEGLLYLVMEYLEGRPLSDVLRDDGPLPWRRAVHILRQILKSLWEAHEHPRHIIHRDIKPANVVLVNLPGEEDHVRVLDFGISRALAGSGANTQGMLGTPFYMAPELWRGTAVDARVDLYALGCVAFQMLAGVPPFVPPPSAGDSIMPLLDMHLHAEPADVSELVPEVPEPVADWIAGMLAKDARDRPASARLALEALDRAVADVERAASAGSAPARAVVPKPVAIADTIDAERRRQPGQGSRPGRGAPVPLDATSEPVRDTAAAAAPEAAHTMTATGLRDGRGRPGKGTSWVVPLVIAVAVLGLGVGLAVIASQSRKGADPGAATDPGGVAVATRGGGEPEPIPIDPPPVPVKGDPAPTPTGDEPPPMVHPVYGNLGLAYRARLSAADHEDEDGEALVLAADIVVRDRVRVHTGRADGEDQGDLVFVNDQALAQYHQLLGLAVDPTTAHDIVTGTPLIEVAIYQNGMVVRVVGR